MLYLYLFYWIFSHSSPWLYSFYHLHYHTFHSSKQGSTNCKITTLYSKISTNLLMCCPLAAKYTTYHTYIHTVNPPATILLLQPALQSPQVFYWLVCLLPTGTHNKCKEKTSNQICFRRSSYLGWSWGWYFHVFQKAFWIWSISTFPTSSCSSADFRNFKIERKKERCQGQASICKM